MVTWERGCCFSKWLKLNMSMNQSINQPINGTRQLNWFDTMLFFYCCQEACYLTSFMIKHIHSFHLSLRQAHVESFPLGNYVHFLVFWPFGRAQKKHDGFCRLDGVAHLDQWSLRLQDLDDHHHGDADHGGQCQAPAQTDGPVWVLVHLVIGQGLVFHQREDKTALENKHIPLLVHAVKQGPWRYRCVWWPWPFAINRGGEKKKSKTSLTMQRTGVIMVQLHFIHGFGL